MNEQHISAEDLVLYSLQSLSAGESSSVARHLESCAECRRELAEVSGDLALVGMSVEPHASPAGSRERFLKQILAEPQAVNLSAAPASSIAQRPISGPAIAEPMRERERVVEPLKPKRNWFPILVPWAVAFAMLAIAGYLGSRNQQLNDLLNTDKGQIAQLSAEAARAQQVMDVLSSPAAKQVTLTEGKGAPPPTGRTSYLQEKGALVFVGNNLKAIPANKTYELWIIPANGKAPMPAGLFRPDDRGSASLVLPKLPEGVPAKAFGVTIENAEGSPTPTMPIVLSGAAGL